MGNISKISTLLLVGVVMISGCSDPNKTTKDVFSAVTLGAFDKDPKGTGDIETTGAASEKAELLMQIERKYESPEAHYKLGKLYFGDGLWNKAEWEYNVALGFKPGYYEAQAAMVKTLIVSGNEPRSTFAAEQYINQAATSAKRSLLLGQAFQKEGLDDYALACYQQALGLAPSSAALYRQIGYYHLSKGDKIRAEENLRRSFQLDPYQAEVAGELGRLGVIVQIPRKKQSDGKNLDKLLNKNQ